MSIAYLALGSNLGNRERNLTQAIEAIKALKITVEKVSTIIETEPVGGPVQGKYLNAVIKIQTTIPAEELRYLTRKIEIQMGRVKNEMNGPRIIDIDILLYDNIKLMTRTLQIPHPRMYERDFVMKPLSEIDPQQCVLLKPSLN